MNTNATPACPRRTPTATRRALAAARASPVPAPPRLRRRRPGSRREASRTAGSMSSCRGAGCRGRTVWTRRRRERRAAARPPGPRPSGPAATRPPRRRSRPGPSAAASSAHATRCWRCPRRSTLGRARPCGATRRTPRPPPKRRDQMVANLNVKPIASISCSFRRRRHDRTSPQLSQVCPVSGLPSCSRISPPLRRGAAGTGCRFREPLLVLAEADACWCAVPIDFQPCPV